MIKKIDVSNTQDKVYKVGYLSDDIIEFLGLKIDEKAIFFNSSRFRHIKKHISDFKNYDDYKNNVQYLPDIIQSPDYIGVHPNGESIEFIKRVNKIMLVAVRIKKQGALWVRSVFPITEDKLNLYLSSGTTKKFNKYVDRKL